jgi:hypothetical protein
MGKFLLLVCLVSTHLLNQVNAQTQPEPAQPGIYKLFYPGEREDNLRSKYQITLLKHALSYSQYRFLIKENGQHIPTARNFKLLEKNEIIQVLWSTLRNDRKEKYLAVEIPILKGLLGLRIPLIHQQANNLFANTLTLNDLQKFTAGQLDSWSDAQILRHNNISVNNGVNFEALFKMLAIKRFDYFPRSIVEIHDDLERNKNLPITIDPNIAIFYPNVLYFFVNKDNQFLHGEILSGLEKAIQDGSFEKIFKSFHQEHLNKFDLKNRRIIHLTNPLLPDTTPTHRPELWLHLL